MKRNTKELNAILDKVVGDIRNEQIDSSVIDDAASRIWARISEQAVNNAQVETVATVPAFEHIGGCADFQSLIPSYLRGELSP
ncbi:MAG: hypothetical protein H0V88_15190, partial [Pyrinomonadaceae bacterium]|nr:hypothetical protein [Pyrinomonadaceae bacterium]